MTEATSLMTDDDFSQFIESQTENQMMDVVFEQPELCAEVSSDGDGDSKQMDRGSGQPRRS